MVNSTDTGANGGDELDLAHLHEAARRIARLPDDERLRYVRADPVDRLPPRHRGAGPAANAAGMAGQQRMPNLLLIGPTNNGKSMIIEKFHRTHPTISHADREELPVLVVSYLAIRADDQLENRFAPLTLPRWEAAAGTCSLLASFAASFPRRRPSRSPPSTWPPTCLLARSEGTIGELSSLLTDGALAAIESGEEAINHHTLCSRHTQGRPSCADCASANSRETTPHEGTASSGRADGAAVAAAPATRCAGGVVVVGGRLARPCDIPSAADLGRTDLA